MTLNSLNILYYWARIKYFAVTVQCSLLMRVTVILLTGSCKQLTQAFNITTVNLITSWYCYCLPAHGKSIRLTNAVSRLRELFFGNNRLSPASMLIEECAVSRLRETTRAFSGKHRLSPAVLIIKKFAARKL